MIPFSTHEKTNQPETFVIGSYTKYDGTHWFPHYLPTSNVVHQQLLSNLIYVVDPPLDLPASPIQLYKRSLCVEHLVRETCSLNECPHEHTSKAALWRDLSLYKRRENTVGTIPEAVDELERRTPYASPERMKAWVAKQQYFGVVIFSKNHPVYWVRNFKSIDIGRMEFWTDLECMFTAKKRVVIIQKPLVADLRPAQAIKLFSKPLCLFYFQFQKCERTNCTFLHRTEDEISLAIAKKYYEIKCLSKNERFEHIVRIDGLGQTTQFTTAEKLRYQLEEREIRRAEKSTKEGDSKHEKAEKESQKAAEERERPRRDDKKHEDKYAKHDKYSQETRVRDAHEKSSRDDREHRRREERDNHRRHSFEESYSRSHEKRHREDRDSDKRRHRETSRERSKGRRERERRDERDRDRHSDKSRDRRDHHRRHERR